MMGRSSRLLGVWSIFAAFLLPQSAARVGEASNFTGSSVDLESHHRQLESCTDHFDSVSLCYTWTTGDGCHIGKMYRITKEGDGRQSAYMKSNYDVELKSGYDPNVWDRRYFHFTLRDRYITYEEQWKVHNSGSRTMIGNVGRGRDLQKKDIGTQGGNEIWKLDSTEGGNCDTVKIANSKISRDSWTNNWWNNQSGGRINLVSNRGQGESYRIERVITERENCAREWGGSSSSTEEYFISVSTNASRKLYMKSDGSIVSSTGYNGASSSKKANYRWRIVHVRNYSFQTVRLFNVGRNQYLEASGANGSQTNSKFIFSSFWHSDSCAGIKIGFINPGDNYHMNWMKWDEGSSTFDWDKSHDNGSIFEVARV